MAKATRVRLLDSGSLVIDQSHITWNVGCGTPVRFPVYSVLIEHPDGLFMFDTGYDLELVNAVLPFELPEQTQEQTVPAQLATCGFKPEDVDAVINSHLHFDHCGGNTRVAEGKVIPAFANAEYIVQRGEFDHACHPTERDRASYMPDNFEPIAGSDQWRLLDHDEQIVPGVELLRMPGHTADMMGVRLTGGGETAILFADLVPTTAHLPLAWVLGFDSYPLTTLENKRKWLGEAVRNRWLVLFAHDTQVPAARLHERAGKIVAEAVVVD
jgi:4-pyridoxolactonase